MIFTFGTGDGANTKELYEALQYSGLVTEDMTFDEMCAVLLATYPEGVYLYKSGNEYTDITGGWTKKLAVADFVINRTDTYLEIYNASTYGNYVLACPIAIDVTGYSKIVWDIQFTIDTSYGNNQMICGCGLLDTLQSNYFGGIAIHQTSTNDGRITLEKDISGKSGVYYPYIRAMNNYNGGDSYVNKANVKLFSVKLIK